MKIPDVALLQHSPSEGGGIIEEYLVRREIPLQRIELFSTNEMPPLSSTHLLIMGGPMSVNDEDEFPWLRQEKELIRTFIQRGAPVLGICLGAQLIAAAGGAGVYGCDEELGWSPVFRIPTTFDLLPDRFMAFQMHGETFDLPQNAKLICRGGRVVHQALCWGSALGFQFHLELTRKIITDWIRDRPAKVQAEILGMSGEYLPLSQHLAELVIERFLSAPGGRFAWLKEKA
jgi:GMP synthase-like glutamine amidotransferase